MKTFNRRHVATALACVPAMIPLSNLALAEDAKPLEPQVAERPLRIFSTANGDKLTITVGDDGMPIFTWTAKEDLKD